MTPLQELKAELLELVKQRDRVIEKAQLTIDIANRAFDRQAMHINRKIKELDKANVRNPRSGKPQFLDSIPEEDRELYLELQRAGKCR
jgi:hypothetical protein